MISRGKWRRIPSDFRHVYGGQWLRSLNAIKGGNLDIACGANLKVR